LNIIFFFIPFLIVAGTGIYQDVFAVETVTGYNYFDVANPDGTHTWSTHEPYILNNGAYVPFVNSGLQTQTDLTTVTLNADGSYTWAGKFTDKIIAKYADVSDLTSWTYPNTLNNDTPDVSWNGSAFISSKVKAGVGQLDYKYVLINGVWKTQLEATNLSSLTTRAFGFDQIIDLESDTISFGGVTRNLDNFNGTTFSKQFLIDNKGKVLEFLNGVNFDFDLGFANLYSVTVYDTGINKSRLVFDYRTSDVLLPNNTLIIDPTFGYTAGTGGYIHSNGCAGASISKTSTGSFNIGKAGTFCYAGWEYWDISTIPDIATITDVSVKYTVTAKTLSGDNCDWFEVTGNFSTLSDADTWTDATSGTKFVSESTQCNSVSTDKVLDLGSNADADLQAELVVDNEWGIGVYGVNRVAGNYIDVTDVRLQVIYTITPPNAVIDLGQSIAPTANTIGINWTAPYAGSGGQAIIGYQINMTTPQTNNPLIFVNDTGTTTPNYNVTGLVFGTDYSTRVTAWTNVTGGHPLNNATGNVFNFTTSTTTYSDTPTITLVTPHGSAVKLDLEFTAGIMTNINGYKIQRETPLGAGWVTLTGNTTTATLFYNDTAPALATNIIYNYRIYSLNGTGISTASNEYDMTTFHLPDAVTDLTAVADDFTTVELDWTTPTSYAPEITDYQINYTSPFGDPQTIIIHTPVVTVPPYTVLGLAVGDGYSFRISAITIHGMNTTGNIANATTTTTYELGNLSDPDETNTDDFQIFYNQTNTNSTSILLDVTYPSSYTLSCNMFYKFARTNTTYTGLTETPITGYGNDTNNVESSFVFNGNNTEIITIDCEDVLTGDSAKYIVTIQQFELLDQIANFRNGTYGTMGQIGGLDLITLIVVIIGMIGFNRVTPVAGVVFTCITVGTLAWFGIIETYQIMFPAFALVILLAYTRTRQSD
jgi:hypothetical protein